MWAAVIVRSWHQVVAGFALVATEIVGGSFAFRRVVAAIGVFIKLSPHGFNSIFAL